MSDWTGVQIEEAFTRGDCLALSLELLARYKGLQLYVLVRGAEEEWLHTLVKDRRDGRFIDIMGAHTLEEVCKDWGITRADGGALKIDRFRRRFRGMARHHSEIPVVAAVEYILSRGWNPPPRRPRITRTIDAVREPGALSRTRNGEHGGTQVR